MPFTRSLGRWAMTALVINCVIGSGIFAIPSELTRLVGWLSPLAIVAGALVQIPIIASIAEVSSQFTEPGGAYLYARTVFGRFAGLQVGWFSLLAPIAGVAANAGLFVAYLTSFFPVVGTGAARAAALAVLIALPAAANYIGVRRGGNFSNALVLAKLLPMLILIGLGVARFAKSGLPELPPQAFGIGWSGWVSAFLLVTFTFGGYEDAIVPAGEVRDTRHTMGFALGVGLLTCTVLYTLLQLVTLVTVGFTTSARPLADAAFVLIGAQGSVLVALAVMVSTYGNVSAGVLTTPRLAYALASHGEFPAVLGRLHPRFHTPGVSILSFAVLVWILAVTGTFMWAMVLSAGSMMVMYGSTCAALIRLRRLNPKAQALRVPFGPALAACGIAISCLLLTQLQRTEWGMMFVTFAIAAANWWWVKGHGLRSAVANREAAS